MSIEDQFDVAAQDRRADAAKAAPDLTEKVAEVPEVPGKVEQEPEIQAP